MAQKDELIEIVGRENVLDDAERLKEYAKDLSFVHGVSPQFVVKPRVAGEVQALIKWANETKMPLVPVSSGPPHFWGDTIPFLSGVIVELSRMNKVIRVDRRNRMVMVEPGVRFGELQQKLGKEGLRLNMPLLPRSSKSVVTSLLEREPVIIPQYQWDVIDPLSCVEVIFGTGDLFRTGAAAGPGTLEDQWQTGQAQANPQGPGQADLSRIVQGSQGTMGIVTWATIRCELLPTLQKPFLVGSQRLERLSEFIYQLLWLKLVDECLVLNNTNLAAILTKEWPEEYNRIRGGLPSWVLLFCLAGYQYFPRERVEYQEKDMLAAAKKLGVEPVGEISGVSAYRLLEILGSPSDEPYWKLGYKGACQDIFFLTTLDKVPKFVDVTYDIAKQYGYPCSDIGIYIQPMVQGTNCHCEFNLFYDLTDTKEAARVQGLFSQASEALINTGAFFSRPYGTWADIAYRRDAETTIALRKVKGIFDPNNVMNPGKLCF